MLSSLGSRLGLGSLCAALSWFCGDHTVSYLPSLPPSYPLAVRNPYLSTWMPSDQVPNLPYSDSQFWAGQNLTWAVIARVDGQAYSLMGVADPGSDIRPAVVHTAEYTATHSVFTLSAGSVTFKLDFFSPVSPSNYLRQSLPFSYLTVTVSGAASNEVQIYSDIDGRWTGRTTGADWAFHRTGGTAMYSLSLDNEAPYTENHDMALWGHAILASRPSESKLSSSSGDAQIVRSQFARHGNMDGDGGSLRHNGVVALSHNLGTVTGEQPVNFAVGYVREKAINYLGDAYTGYYRAEYPDTFDAVSYFLDDYPDAFHESVALDRELDAKAKATAGQKYSDIVALSTRQAYGGLDLTIPNDSLDTNQILVWCKELSSNGDIQTVDILAPSFPIYWVFDSNYIRLILEPIMRYLAAGRWHKPYMIHDMGIYPNAIGHDDQQAEPMPIEECGNLLVLALAYQRATGDTSWTAQYTDIMRGYADYLIENGVDIANQLSSNDAAGPLPNETNLAIKAAVGIKAFGELTGSSEYSRIGEERAHLFFNEGLGTDEEKTHFVLEYPDMESSWKIPYNLYPDVLLNLGTFPQAAYDMGSKFLSTVRGEYGVALDNRQDWAKSDWNMWTAATVDNSTRDEFVEDFWAFMTNGQHNWPLSDRYVSTSAYGSVVGVPILCRARPTVGGHYALLALQGPSSLEALGGQRVDWEQKEGQRVLELHGEEL